MRLLPLIVHVHEITDFVDLALKEVSQRVNYSFYVLPILLLKLSLYSLLHSLLGDILNYFLLVIEVEYLSEPSLLILPIYVLPIEHTLQLLNLEMLVLLNKLSIGRWLPTEML